jgi:hypothetical protein
MVTAWTPPAHWRSGIDLSGNRHERTNGISDLLTQGVDCTEKLFRRLGDADESGYERHEHV